DISSVQNPHRQQIDWTLHLQGKTLDVEGVPAIFSTHGPLAIMHDARVVQLNNSQPRHFSTAHSGQALWLHGQAELWQGNAPDNPAVQDLSYLVLRSQEQSPEFVCVWDFDTQQPITEMQVTPDTNGILILLKRSEMTLVVDVAEDYAVLPHLKTWHIPF
ncbi:MAG TPA: alginate lyase, partial [Buttiauxella sp.]